MAGPCDVRVATVMGTSPSALPRPPAMLSPSEPELSRANVTSRGSDGVVGVDGVIELLVLNAVQQARDANVSSRPALERIRQWRHQTERRDPSNLLKIVHPQTLSCYGTL